MLNKLLWTETCWLTAINTYLRIDFRISQDNDATPSHIVTGMTRRRASLKSSAVKAEIKAGIVCEQKIAYSQDCSWILVLLL